MKVVEFMANQPREMTFDDILKGREYYKDLIEMLGISKSVHSENRIFKIYDLISRIYSLENDELALDLYLKKEGYDATILFVKVEAAELSLIFKELLTSNTNREILITKIMQLSAGSVLLTEETAEQNLARNTQFELFLYAQFHREGFKVSLEDPNPDLQLTINGHIYNIECKRIFSKKRFEDNYRSARNQLIARLSNRPEELGIIAISVDRLMNEPGMAFMYDKSLDRFLATEQMNERLGEEIKYFIQTHKKKWYEDAKFQALNAPALIFQYRGVVTGNVGNSATNLFSVAEAKARTDLSFDTFVRDLSTKLAI